MSREEEAGAPPGGEIAELARQRAENVFAAKGFCCSESILYVLNAALGGGLPPETALHLGSGFCHGMGGAGCACGALAGSEAVLGLFLSHRQPGGVKKKEFEALCREMHDLFKERFGATCCRVLLKKRKEKQGASCQELTGGGAALVTSLLLRMKPELAAGTDMEFLRKRDSKAGNLVRKALGKGPAA
ncbi:MAG: C-GCAxxG-C-C family protein [Desulfobacteraceae bacterium]|nr:C-GCAxxG-C-C family protein [Desulfobacteraceae bacterium]